MIRARIPFLFELKAAKEDGTFEGLASPFGELDQGGDIVMKGAFSETLAEYEAKGRRVPMLWQHNPREPIGMYPTLKETDTGLEVVGQCNMEVQQGREAHALMKQGALSGLSIGYAADKYTIDNETGIRTLVKLKLYEISPVTFPMADSARVSVVKSLEEAGNLSDCERILRDAGFDKQTATAFTARVKAIATRSDSASDNAASINRAFNILRNR